MIDILIDFTDDQIKLIEDTARATGVAVEDLVRDAVMGIFIAVKPETKVK